MQILPTSTPLLSYSDKQDIMAILFKKYEVKNNSFTSVYKNIPIELYEQYKQFIDYTAFYTAFRGKRNFKVLMLRNGNMYKQYDASTRKVNANRVDLYMFEDNVVRVKRLERETFLKAQVWLEKRGMK